MLTGVKRPAYVYLRVLVYGQGMMDGCEFVVRWSVYGRQDEHRSRESALLVLESSK